MIKIMCQKKIHPNQKSLKLYNILYLLHLYLLFIDFEYFLKNLINKQILKISNDFIKIEEIHSKITKKLKDKTLFTCARQYIYLYMYIHIYKNWCVNLVYIFTKMIPLFT